MNAVEAMACGVITQQDYGYQIMNMPDVGEHSIWQAFISPNVILIFKKIAYADSYSGKHIWVWNIDPSNVMVEHVIQDAIIRQKTIHYP